MGIWTWLARVETFAPWRGQEDMVRAGLFARVFDAVGAFYRVAADAGQLVIVSRG